MIHRVLENVLHISFLVGLLIQVTSLFDLLLTKRQQSLLQSRVEMAALWLDDTNPLDWYSKVVRLKYFKWFTLGILLYLSIDFSYKQFNGKIIHGSEGYLLVGAVILVFILNSIMIVSIFIFFHRKGQKMIDYMYADGKFGKFLLRYVFYSILVLAMFTILVVMVIFYLKGIKAYPEYFWWLSLVTFTIFFVFIGRFIVTMALAFLGNFIIYFKLFLFVLLLLVKSLKFIFWRIAEYNKGALAAITLVVTFILGILELFVKMK